MMTHAGGASSDMSAGEGSVGRRGVAVMREHGAVLARVCMALLGDAAAAERALERVATEAGRASFAVGDDALARVLGMARVACAQQLSRVPIRAASLGGDDRASTRGNGREAALARVAIGRLRPTEREALVLHLVGGLDAVQVAEACSLDVETARGRIARAVAQLAQDERDEEKSR